MLTNFNRVASILHGCRDFIATRVVDKDFEFKNLTASHHYGSTGTCDAIFFV